jgi:GAF domain-containing protein
MSQSDKLHRSWKEIAKQLADATDPVRFNELAIELSDALGTGGVGERMQGQPKAGPRLLDRRSPTLDDSHRTESNPYLRFGNNAWVPDLLASTLAASAADFGNVQLIDDRNGALRIVAQRGFGDEFLTYFGNVGSNDACACGAAMKRRSRVVVTDAATDPMFRETAARDVLLRANVRSVQSTPLIDTAGNFIGIVSTHYNRPTSLAPSVWQDVDDVITARMAEINLLRHPSA